MKEDDLRVNQLIEVEMIYDGEKVVLSSRIEDIRDDYLLIAAPIRHGIPLIMPSGSEVMVQFWVRDTLWGFNSVVSGRRLRPVPMW
ncbi:MAG TPA: flagellar brake protein, partial [Syntrophomonadaceae bacterium]|nr:flagellar brake protein [Syntrophomonadaceae bacterium]